MAWNIDYHANYEDYSCGTFGYTIFSTAGISRMCPSTTCESGSVTVDGNVE